jgi:hypothetical protein
MCTTHHAVAGDLQHLVALCRHSPGLGLVHLWVPRHLADGHGDALLGQLGEAVVGHLLDLQAGRQAGRQKGEG